MSTAQRQADAYIRVEKGDDPRTLIAAFTGGMRRPSNRKFAFADLCARLGCSRILVRDPYSLCYMRGIGPTPGTFQSVPDFLRRQIDILKPERTLLLGESIGGHAAILAGHLLRVDAVHAFAPFTYLNLTNIIRKRNWTALRSRRRLIARLYLLAWRSIHRFDLRRPLCRPNGLTRYYVHVCRRRSREFGYAQHLGGVPRVHVIPHPGETHLVANYMIRQKILLPWLELSQGRLDLSGTNAGDGDLVPIEALTDLASLDLRDTKVTDTGVARLKDAMPSLRVTCSPHGLSAS